MIQIPINSKSRVSFLILFEKAIFFSVYVHIFFAEEMHKIDAQIVC